jgi:PIN domain nuclease of toxin-antitoxin system
MKLLLDTHLLLWAIGRPGKLPVAARKLMANPRNELLFSVASIWEIAIKYAHNRAKFRSDPRLIRRSLLENDYVELPVLAEHATATADLPLLHPEPFDRLLIAQATVEGIVLLTADDALARYAGPVRAV